MLGNAALVAAYLLYVNFEHKLQILVELVE
jgi:hypothetical protein